MRLRQVLLVLLFATAASSALAAPPRFQLEVSPRRASMADTFYATVVIEVDGVAGADRYWPPKFSGFNVAGGTPERSTSMSFDPGSGRRLVTREIRRYELTAKAAGTYVIEPARIRFAGAEYTTDQAYVVVHPAGSQESVDPLPALPSAGDPTAAGGIGAPGFVQPKVADREPIFLHAVVDKVDAFVGEQVTVTWLLYSTSKVLEVKPVAPSPPAAWSSVLYEPSGFLEYHETMVGRVPYSVAIVSKRAFFATRPGRLRIAPFQATVTVLGSEMGRGEKVRSPPIVVPVKRLPRGAPAGFDSTYVGRFEVTTSVARTELAVGETVALDVVIRGDGALGRLVPPSIEIDGFEVRPAPEDDEIVYDEGSSSIRGERKLRYWITAEKAGPGSVGEVEVSYFDPKTGGYATATSEVIPVLVRDPVKGVGEVATSDLKDNVLQRDIRLLHTRDLSSASGRILPFVYQRWWFWLLAGIPGFLFAVVVTIDRLLRRMRRETSRARLRRARGNAKRRLRLAEIHLRGNRPKNLYGELAHVVYEHLECLLDKPLQSMTRDELQSTLKEAGYAQATIERVTKVLDESDVARFSPTAASREEMRRAMSRVRSLLGDIEGLRTGEVAA